MKRIKWDGDIVNDPELAGELIALSQDTISVDNLHYRIEPDLYRDFFPGVLPKRRPLIASISFICCDGIPFSADLKITKVYIIKGDLIWISTPSVLNESTEVKLSYSYVSKNGPEWETGIKVDVVVEVLNSMDTRKYYLKKQNVNIIRVE